MVGVLAHVLLVEAGDRIWVRFMNGACGPLELQEEPEVQVGSTVLVDDDGYELAPEQLFPAPQPRVGIVRAVEPERTLVEADGNLFWQRHSGPVNWTEWDTVEWNDAGMLSRLAERPIRYRDDKPAAAEVHSRFRVAPGDVTETFDKIAGLDSQIEQLRQIVSLMHDADELEAKGYRPLRGILLAGESGTGKTMLARALSKEADAAFFQVRGPEVASKWVNESEETLRALLDEADTCDRAIVFFDEIDSIATSRSADQHHMANKLITQLLTLMDGFKPRGRTLVVGATNRADTLDPTLLRSGRFDRRIDFALPDIEDRSAILRATAPSDVSKEAEIEVLAGLTEGWCSADLRGLWREAHQFARTERRSIVRHLDCLVAIERMAPQVNKRRELTGRE